MILVSVPPTTSCLLSTEIIGAHAVLNGYGALLLVTEKYQEGNVSCFSHSFPVYTHQCRPQVVPVGGEHGYQICQNLALLKKTTQLKKLLREHVAY